MSSHDPPQMEDGDSDLAQSSLLERILENQEAIHGLSEKLMPLLMGNLQRLAESNRPEYDPLVDTETNSDLPRDPRNPRNGRKEPAAQHVVGSGESDLRLGAVAMTWAMQPRTTRAMQPSIPRAMQPRTTRAMQPRISRAI